MKKILKNLILCMGTAFLLGFSLNAYAQESEYVPVIVDFNAEELSTIRNMNPIETNMLNYNVAIQNRASGILLGTLSLTKGNGVLSVTYITDAMGRASEVGVTNCRLQRKDYGFWNSIYTRTHSYSINSYTHMGGFSLTNPEEGKTYRIVTNHYVILNGVKSRSYGETNGYTY